MAIRAEKTKLKLFTNMKKVFIDSETPLSKQFSQESAR